MTRLTPPSGDAAPPSPPSEGDLPSPDLAAELALLRSASERAALVSLAAGIGTWELHLDSGHSLWDAQMWRLRGLAPCSTAPSLEQMLALLVPEDRDRIRGELQRAHQEDRPSEYEFRVAWPDGSVRWLTSRSVLMRDESGRSVRRIGVNWDVTDARLAEAERAQKALALSESQAKSGLLARISHELRTPLNAILGFNQLLLSEDKRTTPQSRRRHLEHIRLAADHLLNLVNDVLELSRSDADASPVPLRPVALGPVLADILPLVEPLAAEKDVSIEVSGLDLTLLAEPTRLKQVLLNLLTNAIKYNRPGGFVQVRGASEGRHAVLTVHDNGIGMHAWERAVVFEPFKRLLSRREGVDGPDGVGIGLAIVKNLVERMGGQVDVRSEPEAGSTFEVRLGAAPSASPEALPSGERQRSLPRFTRWAKDRLWRVLYVEDNPVNVLIVSELLARRGDCQFDSAPDGRTGLALVRQQQPDLVLLDIHLPDIDGRQVLAQLRADRSTAHIPCIALSANAMPNDIRAALNAGFADYWTKPLDFQVFGQALDTMFGAVGANR
jgi:signal transduction histidine kinase/ActR/RegA family two-component response regulator